MNINRVIVAGHLCADPDVRATQSGLSVASLRLAINEKVRDQERTIFIDVTAWDKTADFCRNYLSKGRNILVEGRLRMDQWQDRETGSNRTKIGITAERIYFADSKPQSQQGAPPQQASGSYAQANNEPPSSTDDDLPF
ncbi:MAG TPA: single-stranded DNA-binding protein [Bryobacteraceae bacterium]|nr:single-stranded DNA-binding protein [Bryobacteraceae bacterium]